MPTQLNLGIGLFSRATCTICRPPLHPFPLSIFAQALQPKWRAPLQAKQAINSYSKRQKCLKRAQPWHPLTTAADETRLARKRGVRQPEDRSLTNLSFARAKVTTGRARQISCRARPIPKQRSESRAQPRQLRPPYVPKRSWGLHSKRLFGSRLKSCAGLACWTSRATNLPS
jgi:hypothetical protein